MTPGEIGIVILLGVPIVVLLINEVFSKDPAF